MKVIKPSHEILTPINGDEILKHIELCGRVCYKSEDRITEDSAKRFVKTLIKLGHESVLEHYSITVRIICDRGVSHQLVRHRLASYSQESTRYCNYGKDSEIAVIKPCFLDEGSIEYQVWQETMEETEIAYMWLLDNGKTPEEARAVLPNSLKTEVIVTANLRNWRHILKLRTAKDAHPQIREVMTPLLESLKEQIPVVFDDIEGVEACM